MRTKLIILTAIALLSVAGCRPQLSYFGIENEALLAPKKFRQTQESIEKAEGSPGAQYCPEKIAQAKELSRRGVEIYWGCRDKIAMALLDEAQELAREAEQCQPPPPPPTPLLTAIIQEAPPPGPVIPQPPPLPKVIILEGTQFAFDSHALLPEAQAILDEQAAILTENPGLKLRIEGHADSRGPEVYNQGLSERRAGAVKDYLVSKGIWPDRLEAKGYGESFPIASNDTSEGQAKNRRVELHIIHTIEIE
jgi:outer membrane protein OmpA-like peptidoglycan-associated protein